jgi:hypothetical protein
VAAATCLFSASYRNPFDVVGMMGSTEGSIIGLLRGSEFCTFLGQKLAVSYVAPVYCFPASFLRFPIIGSTHSHVGWETLRATQPADIERNRQNAARISLTG